MIPLILVVTVAKTFGIKKFGKKSIIYCKINKMIVKKEINSYPKLDYVDYWRLLATDIYNKNETVINKMIGDVKAKKLKEFENGSVFK